VYLYEPIGPTETTYINMDVQPNKTQMRVLHVVAETPLSFL